MHSITEEQLASLESDYITRESAAIIANEVRKTTIKSQVEPNELLTRGVALLEIVCARYAGCFIYNSCSNDIPIGDEDGDENYCQDKCPANRGARSGGCNIRDFYSNCEEAGIKFNQRW